MDHEIDEVLQEVRICLWKALGQRERVEEVRGSYIHRTALSAALDLIRGRRGREQPLEDGDGRPGLDRVPGGPGGGGSVPGPDALLEGKRLQGALAGALDALPERRRVPVRMHLLGYGTEEMARVLGWTEPTVRNLLYRGLADLRKELLHRGVTPPGEGRSTG